jgi:hypothetical protein
VGHQPSPSLVVASDQAGLHKYSADTLGQPYHFSHLLMMKLTANNYPLWRAQVLPHLCSHYLEGFINGS